MGAIATFDYTLWSARFPELVPPQGTVTSPLATSYFTEATIFHANDGSGPVADANQQLLLLNLLTAHIAALNAPPTTGGQSNPLVGRITNASEGSVSVQVENDYPPGTAQWFQQTKYGSEYWTMTLNWRTARYLVGPRRRFGTPLWGGGSTPWPR